MGAFAYGTADLILSPFHRRGLSRRTRKTHPGAVNCRAAHAASAALRHNCNSRRPHFPRSPILPETTYYQAPLAGYTDLPYRRMCRECGAYWMFTALIDSGALIHGNRDNDSILLRGKEEPWLGVQLLGGIPEHVARASEMLDTMDFDAVDFNMGCPMQKVLKRPAGAALLRPENQELALRCVDIMRGRIHKPLTVKMRILDFNDPAPTVELCRRLEGCGIDGVTIHGRTTESIYAGPVAWDVIRAVRESLSVPVTANGGIFGAKDAARLRDATGCTRLMVARGSIGNPWIFRELAKGAPAPPSHGELCDAMEKHISGMAECYGERTGMILGRKIATAYLHGRGYRKEYRIRGSQMASMADFLAMMADLRREGPVAGPLLEGQ